MAEQNPQLTSADRSNRLRDERIAALDGYGIKAEAGGWLGAFVLGAPEAEKLLRLLRRLTKANKGKQSGEDIDSRTKRDACLEELGSEYLP